MNEILTKLITGKPVEKADLVDALREVCDNVHASCGEDCPVYERMSSEERTLTHRGYCEHFKNGQSMLNYIAEKEGLDA